MPTSSSPLLRCHTVFRFHCCEPADSALGFSAILIPLPLLTKQKYYDLKIHTDDCQEYTPVPTYTAAEVASFPSLFGEKLVAFAQSQLGSQVPMGVCVPLFIAHAFQVGNGECWTLVNNALLVSWALSLAYSHSMATSHANARSSQ
jgi:hypothetical protein